MIGTPWRQHWETWLALPRNCFSSHELSVFGWGRPSRRRSGSSFARFQASALNSLRSKRIRFSHKQPNGGRRLPAVVSATSFTRDSRPVYPGTFPDAFSSPRQEMDLYAHSPKRELEPERRGERGESEANDDDRDIERPYACLPIPPIICQREWLTSFQPVCCSSS